MVMDTNTWSDGSKDRLIGKAKEKLGIEIGNEELEFKGKAQQMKGNMEDFIEDTKERVLKNANDWLDKRNAK